MVDQNESLSETARRQILLTIRTGPKSVNQIVEETGLKQPNVSNHLGRLLNRNIVSQEKHGRQVFYQLASREIDSILQALVSVRNSAPISLNYEELAPAYLECALDGDEEGALEIIEAAFQACSNLLEIYENLLGPAMRSVGDLYEAGKISEAGEHMASEITLRCMARTVHVAGPARRNGKKCVIGCAPNEWHVIGSRMASDVLRLSGWRTIFCGANVPIRSFLTAVHQNQPDMALISCTNEFSNRDAVQLVRELSGLRMRQHHFLIGVGGRLTRENMSQLKVAGADFATTNMRSFAVDLVPQIETGGQLSETICWPGLA